MEDVIRSIKAFLYDRSSSPLFGAVIVSWVFVNYEVFIFIFSGLGPQEKIDGISSYFNDGYLYFFGHEVSNWFCSGVFFPLLAAGVYLFLYPFIAEPVYRFSLKRQQRLHGIKKQEEGLRLLDSKESAELLRYISELQGEYDKETDFLRKQVTSLREQLDKYEKISPSVKSIDFAAIDKGFDSLLSSNDFIEKLRGLGSGEKGGFSLKEALPDGFWDRLDLTERQRLDERFKVMLDAGKIKGIEYSGKGAGDVALYKRVALSVDQAAGGVDASEKRVLSELAGRTDGSSMVPSEVAARSKMHLDRARLVLDDLKNKGYVFSEKSYAGQPIYELTSKGRRYLLDNKIIVDGR